MHSTPETLRFDQVHIDIARNSTDDFNPFHDPYRWANIRANPFHSPIVLGFQLEFLVADRIHRHRVATGFGETPECLGYSNYDFVFVSALQAAKPSLLRSAAPWTRPPACPTVSSCENSTVPWS